MIHVKGNNLVLSSGRRFYTNGGLNDLSPVIDGAERGLNYGCDGGAWEEPTFAAPNFTLEERREIATYMINLWQKWMAD